MQKELSTNGGNSLKDAIIDLRQTCHRIRKTKIIEQRTKAALHYSNVALFETDIAGRLVWVMFVLIFRRRNWSRCARI